MCTIVQVDEVALKSVIAELARQNIPKGMPRLQKVQEALAAKGLPKNIFSARALAELHNYTGLPIEGTPLS